MNFLDTFDITGGSNTPPPSDQPEQSLNEELSQVVGQLGRFWGGFRKQSQTALEIARKDIGEVVSQAQKELSKLTTEAPQEPLEDQGVPEASETAEAGPSSEVEADSSSSTTPDQPTPTGGQTLFSRLSSSLPPSIVATVQSNLPESLKHASENIDFVQLRNTLSAEFQRVQGVTRAQAEEYVHKSEALLREAVKEAGEVLREAVKVVPPEEAAATSGVVWDGTDVWMLPSTTPESAGEKGKGREDGSRPSGEAQRAGATRAEALLKKLKHEPEIIQVDPAAVNETQDLFGAWVETAVDGTEGGLDNEEWTKKIASVLEDPVDGSALQATRDILVPSQITVEAFWKRYFFRVHQIEQEEERRKALLQGPIESEEDFSWEDDEEDAAAATSSSSAMPHRDASPPADGSSSQHTLNAPTANASAPSSQVVTPATTSPRDSSEDSYDLVSSANVSTSGEKREPEAEADDDGAESDWE